ncbi:histone-like nucleoid-structuring protein Lsr2, partial [Streptomyces adustus]|uniref:histone-like nucleoid-structuring protein Lsr2 n=1 Tax=Streptomyces adustus TaxID=1609272 RepID=UPI00371FA3D0
GKAYEIDLNDKNAANLRKALEPFIAAGRKAKPSMGARVRGVVSKVGSEDTTVIRAWAKEQGMEVNDRGRVPAAIREAYARANG